MTEPVSTTEIADLLHHLRALSDNPRGNPGQTAAVLARKADILTRIANQHADEWTCEHAEQARQVALDAHAVADEARRLADKAQPTREQTTPAELP